jgi:hypothetical protein
MSTRKLNQHRVAEESKHILKKRKHRAIEDDSEDYMDSNTEVREIRIKEEQQVSHKRQKTASNFKADDLGADISSPDKQPSTKQSENEDDQPTTAASKHYKEVSY